MRKKVISAKAAEKTPRSLNTRYHVFVIFSGPRESDDFRGSHASGTAVCPSCRDAVHDLKRSAASPPRLFAVCQSTICRFVFTRRGFAAHGMEEGTSERDIIEFHTRNITHIVRAIVRSVYHRVSRSDERAIAFLQ